MNFIFESGKIFSKDDMGNILAEATYLTKNNNEIEIDRTFVSPSLRGQGVAKLLMEEVANYLVENKLKATASCSFAKSWLQRNRQKYSQIISKDFDDVASACNITKGK